MNFKSIRSTIWIPPLVVFLAVMTVVLSSFFITRSTVANERENELVKYAARVEDDITGRLRVFEETLRSGNGLFVSTDNVTSKTWGQFIEASNVLERYPGAQGIGYAAVVNKNDIPSFEKQQRESNHVDFTFFPTGVRDMYTSIIYLEPLDSRNKRAIGYDMSSEETRRAAMIAARDSGEPKISGAVRLRQENGDDEQLGFLIYIPQFARTNLMTVDERQDALEGYVYAVFRSETFFGALFSEATRAGAAFSIVAENRPLESLYNTPNYSEIVDNEHQEIKRTLNVDGANWVISYVYQPSVLLPQSLSARPSGVLFFGSFAAILLTVIIFQLLRSKTNQLLLEKERETNDAKDSLLSIASHQLRTPATGVKQYLGMVLQGFVGDISTQQQSMLDKAYESNERQLKTINDVLYLARIDSARLVLSKTNIVLQDLITSIVDEQQEDIDSNQHTLALRLPKKSIKVYADEHMLRMAIENLLTNAVKYTKEKGKIQLSLKETKKEVSVEVKDNGVGIADDDLNLLFKEFTRIKNELSKSVSGTGIGLYLAKHLMELHDGDIRCVSKIGKGTTFTLILPKSIS
jgi:signal transduction histidine kinase